MYIRLHRKRKNMELTDNRTATKRAGTDYEILDVLAERYSPRSFEQTEVRDEVLNKLFEAMRWAPSSMNEQPWRIVYAKKGEKAHEKIVETLMPGNKFWAKEASVLLMTIVKTTFDRGSVNKSAQHDLGLAMGNLSVQATHEGLGLHQMGGFSPEKAIALFNIPEGYEPVTTVAIGYYGSPDQLEGEMRDRELSKRSRKPISAFAFHQQFKI